MTFFEPTCRLKVILAAVIAGLILHVLDGCTVAPKPVVATQIAFDNNTQNAGIIDCNKTGCLVTPGWLTKYKAMEDQYKNYFDVQTTPEGPNYRVSFETVNHYAIMRSAERGGP